MKITYDQDVDALTIIFKQGEPVVESDEAKPGVVLDFDSAGELVSIELLDASKRMPNVTHMEFQLTPEKPAESSFSD